MSRGNQFEIAYASPEKKELSYLKESEFSKHSVKLRSAIEYMIREAQKIGDFELSEFVAKIEVEAGVLIFKATGGIQMTWKNPKFANP